MVDTILCVDDDPNILEAYRRQLRKEFRVETAIGPEEGCRKIESSGPYAVVVSDLQMPNMNGIQFLTKVREQSPDTVRMLLTGNADLNAAVEAVNQGQIFRFLTKPCSQETFAAALSAGLAQYRLIVSERELLEQTLNGCIKVLSEVLALVNPEAFGRSSRIARYAEAIAADLKVMELWLMKAAAMLSQIGCVILPEAVLTKVYRGEALTPEETQLYNQHPFVASDLMGKIPRMKQVAEIIKFQDVYYDGCGTPNGSPDVAVIPIGARILKVALDFDALESSGKSKTEAFDILTQRKGWYHPAVIEALKRAFSSEIRYILKTAFVADLCPGMILGEDLRAPSNTLIATKGQEVTPSMLLRFQNFITTVGIREPFTVIVPIADITQSTPGVGPSGPVAQAPLADSAATH